jgi:hypothetical protein
LQCGQSTTISDVISIVIKNEKIISYNKYNNNSMLNTLNLPTYFIYNDLIRIKISYDQIINNDNGPEVNLLDYSKMLNTYGVHDEFTAYIQIYDTLTDMINENCHNTLYKEDIRRFTYFNYDGTMWNISQLIKVYVISKSEINKVLGHESSIYWLSNLLGLNRDQECTIPVSLLTDDVLTRIFNLLPIHV